MRHEATVRQVIASIVPYLFVKRSNFTLQGVLQGVDFFLNSRLPKVSAIHACEHCNISFAIHFPINKCSIPHNVNKAILMMTKKCIDRPPYLLDFCCVTNKGLRHIKVFGVHFHARVIFALQQTTKIGWKQSPAGSAMVVELRCCRRCISLYQILSCLPQQNHYVRVRACSLHEYCVALLVLYFFTNAVG